MILDQVDYVSIHAPVWGATVYDVLANLRSIVSIHAPVWGATIRWSAGRYLRGFQSTPPYGERLARPRPQSKGSSRFNPRPRMGSDPTQPFAVQTKPTFQSTPPYGERLSLAGKNAFASTVSIHAPVWGATMVLPVRCNSMSSFNPRPRMGSDCRGLKHHLHHAFMAQFREPQVYCVDFTAENQ